VKSSPLLNRYGFTLIELSVVLLIIGIISALIIPRLTSVGDWQLRSSARRLAASITYLYDKASTSRLVYRLTIDLDNGKYFASLLNTDNQFEKIATRYAKNTTLPKTIKINWARTQRHGLTKDGTITIHFLPSGFMDFAIIELADNANNVYTLKSNPLTGEVKITEGKSQPGLLDDRISLYIDSEHRSAA
tara:strand:- start:3 stop:572 length:570 start_codon:yes stop_codon:yes gene_type:complete